MSKSSNLIYENFDDIAILNDETITGSRINKSVKKLIENDNALSPYNQEKPRIWECLWYNDPSVNGYPVGYAVWLNTEEPDTFLRQKKEEIYQYAKNNKYLSYLISSYVDSSKPIYLLYKNILSGYNNGLIEKPFQPLFDIGDYTKDAQIYISISANNKISPTEDLKLPEEERSWKPFIKNEKLVEQIISNYYENVYNYHIKNYHLGEQFAINYENTFIDSYLRRDISNIEDMSLQTYKHHLKPMQLSGFDTVKYYIADKNETSIAISSYVDVFSYKISGEFEISVLSSVSSETGETTDISVNVLSTIVGNVLSTFEDLSIGSPYLSDFNGDNIKDEFLIFEKNKLDPIISANKDIFNYSIPSKWCRLWYSGFLEHGGYINIPRYTQQIKIYFDWNFEVCDKWQDESKTLEDSNEISHNKVIKSAPIYNYPEIDYPFYQNYKFIENNDNLYNSNKNLINKYHYIIDITPINNFKPKFLGENINDIGYQQENQEGVYLNKEIVEMKNNYITLKLNTNRPGAYSYYVAGFITNSYEI